MNGESNGDQEQRKDNPVKPPIIVRFWHSMRRRRVWLRVGDHPKANIAEKITVLITICVLGVGCIQAYIYWRQSQLMQAALGQNERNIILGMAQLAVANRNAASAESGGRDTHELATQAKNQADATARSADTAFQAMNLQNRPWIGFLGFAPTAGDWFNLCQITVYSATVINAGHSPALDATTETEERFFERGKFPKDPPYVGEEHPDEIVIVPGLPIHDHGAKCNSIMDVDAKTMNDPVSKKWLYIYGRVLYKDQFGHLHHTYFCSYHIPMTKELAACPEYNDAN